MIKRSRQSAGSPGIDSRIFRFGRLRRRGSGTGNGLILSQGNLSSEGKPYRLKVPGPHVLKRFFGQTVTGTRVSKRLAGPGRACLARRLQGAFACQARRSQGAFACPARLSYAAFACPSQRLSAAFASQASFVKGRAGHDRRAEQGDRREVRR